MPSVVITIDCTDIDDLEWVRIKTVAAVAEAVSTAEGDGDDIKRLDGTAEVGWEIED